MKISTVSKRKIDSLVPLEWVRANRAASKALETQRALFKNWNLFKGWCEKRLVQALPAREEVLEAFLLYLADVHPVLDRSGKVIRNGMRTSSVAQALWAINTVHRLREFPSPGETLRIQTALAGIRRRKGVRRKQQAPLTLNHLEIAFPRAFPQTLRGQRNKALLLLGFVGCLRRSEIVSLKADQLRKSPHGIQVFLSHSKTDQESAGAWVDIIQAKKRPHLCPVLALQQWMKLSHITNGPLFCHIKNNSAVMKPLSSAFVDSLVKKTAQQAGEDPSQFGGHSLRAGGATYLVEQQKSPFIIAKHGRWKSVNSALRYARHSTAQALADAF